MNAIFLQVSREKAKVGPAKFGHLAGSLLSVALMGTGSVLCLGNALL